MNLPWLLKRVVVRVEKVAKGRGGKEKVVRGKAEREKAEKEARVESWRWKKK